MILQVVAATHVPSMRPLAPSSQEALLIDRMKSSETIKHVAVLNTEPRTWKTPGYEKGAAYIVGQMEALGWDVRIEELPTRSGLYRGVVRNVIATRKGVGPGGDLERKLVVAGAHLDSVRNGPGANDNATGSATLIELAKSFAGIETQNDIQLVWFDGEEAGLLGSRAHVDAHMDDISRTIAMVNMDMVGSANGRVGFDLGYKTSQAVSDALKGVRLRTGLTAVEYAERHSRSDHASFDAKGIPAIDFGVSVKSVEQDDPFYHSPKDTVDKINLDVLEGYGDLIAVTLLDLANRSTRI